jgi:diacylglycerol kinase family enzyme
VLLIHKTTAGRRLLSPGELQAVATDAGHDVRYRDADDDGWPDALDAGGAGGAAGEPPELVVAAGGDGTVRRVVEALVRRRREIPLAILPLGTANNVARSLGVTAPPAQLAAGWASARPRRLDVGRVEAPWGSRTFLEAVGVGAFARLLLALRHAADTPVAERGGGAGAALDPDVARGLRRLRRIVRAAPARRWRLSADGADLTDEHLLVEIMNMPMIGPHVEFAPAADPGDGRLDVALLRARDRDRFVDYLSARLAGREAAPELPVHRARRVELWWDGSPLHKDDDPWRVRRRDRRAARDEPAPLRLRTRGAVAVVCGG